MWRVESSNAFILILVKKKKKKNIIIDAIIRVE